MWLHADMIYHTVGRAKSMSSLGAEITKAVCFNWSLQLERRRKSCPEYAAKIQRYEHKHHDGVAANILGMTCMCSVGLEV
jgi:hypothetical protein